MTSEMPTFREQVSEKAFETMEWLITSLHQAKLTEEQFSAGVNAVFMTLSGLMDDSLFHLVSECAKEIHSEHPTLRRIFINGKAVMTARWKVASSDVVIVGSVIEDGVHREVKTHTKSFDTAKEALDYFNNGVSAFTKVGYVELF